MISVIASVVVSVFIVVNPRSKLRVKRIILSAKDQVLLSAKWRLKYFHTCTEQATVKREKEKAQS